MKVLPRMAFPRNARMLAREQRARSTEFGTGCQVGCLGCLSPNRNARPPTAAAKQPSYFVCRAIREGLGPRMLPPCDDVTTRRLRLSKQTRPVRAEHACRIDTHTTEQRRQASHAKMCVTPCMHARPYHSLRAPCFAFLRVLPIRTIFPFLAIRCPPLGHTTPLSLSPWLSRLIWPCLVWFWEEGRACPRQAILPPDLLCCCLRQPHASGCGLGGGPCPPRTPLCAPGRRPSRSQPNANTLTFRPNPVPSSIRPLLPPGPQCLVVRVSNENGENKEAGQKKKSGARRRPKKRNRK